MKPPNLFSFHFAAVPDLCTFLLGSQPLLHLFGFAALLQQRVLTTLRREVFLHR